MSVNQVDRPSKTSKVFNYVIFFALVVTAIAIGILLKWSFEDETVLKVNNSPFPVRTIRTHPTAGGVVIMNTDFCKTKNVKGKVRTSYVGSGREVFLPMQDENLPKGCHKEEVPVLLPKDLPPDTYIIKFRATYDVNPLKKNIVSEFQSQSVEVVAP